MKFTKGNYKILCGKYKNFDEAVIHTVEGYLFEYDGASSLGVNDAAFANVESEKTAVNIITAVSTAADTFLTAKRFMGITTFLDL